MAKKKGEEYWQSKSFASAGRKALGNQIRKDGDKKASRKAGWIADYVMAKTGRLELGEKLRKEAKKDYFKDHK